MKRALLLALVLLGGCPRNDATSELPKPTVGQVYVYGLLGGGSRQDEVTAVTDDRVSITRSTTLPGAVAVTASAAVTQVEEPLAGPSPSASIAPTMSFTKIGEETLVVTGESFPCEVRKLDAKVDVREWVSARWPHVVKTRSGQFTMLELQQVLPKKEEK